MSTHWFITDHTDGLSPAVPAPDNDLKPSVSAPAAEVVRSALDPMFIDIEECGHPAGLPMIFRNMLVGFEPGGGKSNLLNLMAAHATLDPLGDERSPGHPDHTEGG